MNCISEAQKTESKLPPGWKWVKLGEVCEINPRRPKDFTRPPDASTTFVPMAAVDEKTGTIQKPETVPYSRVAKGYTYFEEADVLFAKITPCMQNGKHVIARNLIDGIGFGTTEFHVLKPRKETLPDWVWYFIRQSHFLQEAVGYFTGAVGQQRVPESFLANHDIPLPPIDEQKHIVAKLKDSMRDTDQARAACEEQIEASQALPSAYLHEVFESAEAKKWEKRKLSEVCDYDSGVWGDEPDNLSSCYPVLRSNNIHSGQMIFNDIAIRKIDAKYIKIKELRTGDILVTTSSGSKELLGKNAIFIQPSDGRTYLFSNFTMRLKPKTEVINSFFLHFYLQTPKVKETLKLIQDTTTGLRNMDRKEFLNQIIPFPSLEIQQRIVSNLKEKMTKVENLQSAIRNQQSAMETLPQAILKKAFEGEL